MFIDARGNLNVEAIVNVVVDCLIGYFQGFLACVLLAISGILQLYGDIGFFTGVQHPVAHTIGFYLMWAGLSYFWYLLLFLLTYIFRWIHPMFHMILYRGIWIITTGFVFIMLISNGAHHMKPKDHIVRYGVHHEDRGYQSL